MTGKKPFVQTYTGCVGGYACRGHCKYCVSRLTDRIKVKPYDSGRFVAGARMASNLGAQTFLATGKGEPTHPENLQMLEPMLRDLGDMLPVREIQTHGANILGNKPVLNTLCRYKHEYGLHIVSLSAVSRNNEDNKEAIHPNYPELNALIDVLHIAGFTVRLSVVLCREYVGGTPLSHTVDIISLIDQLLDYSHADQHTFRSVATPDITTKELLASSEQARWIVKNRVDVYKTIHYIAQHGTYLYGLTHGGSVFVYRGKNVCIASCLTDNNECELRQLIYCPDGKIRTDWKHGASVIV